MAGSYADTSALGRLLLGEPERAAIQVTMRAYDAMWSNELLVVELRRLARRESLSAAGEQMLLGIRMLPLAGGRLEQASRIDPVEVRSLDAIHLSTAVELFARGDIAAMLTTTTSSRTAAGTMASRSKLRLLSRAGVLPVVNVAWQSFDRTVQRTVQHRLKRP